MGDFVHSNPKQKPGHKQQYSNNFTYNMDA